MRRSALGLPFLACLALLAAGPGKAETRSLRVEAEGREILALPLREGERFTLAWRHSVEHEAWEETFDVVAGAIQLVSTRFKTYGAGVPSEGGTSTRIEDGFVVMDGLDRTLGSLTVLARPAQRYRLLWRGEEIDLTPEGKARLLEFSVGGDKDRQTDQTSGAD